MILRTERPPLPAWVGGYFTTAVAVGCAAGYATLATALAGVTPFILFPIAVSVTTLRAGRGPGVAAVGLAALASDYLFLEPRNVLTLGTFTAALVGAYAIPVLLAGRPAPRSASACRRSRTGGREADRPGTRGPRGQPGR
jgi:K+-sensing histidine kinase KdpD